MTRVTLKPCDIARLTYSLAYTELMSKTGYVEPYWGMTPQNLIKGRGRGVGLNLLKRPHNFHSFVYVYPPLAIGRPPRLIYNGFPYTPGIYFKSVTTCHDNTPNATQRCAPEGLLFSFSCQFSYLLVGQLGIDRLYTESEASR